MMYRGPGGGGAGIGRGGRERGRDGASEGGGREQVAAGERRYQEEGSLRQQSEAKKKRKKIHTPFCLLLACVAGKHTPQDQCSESQRSDTQHAATETISGPSKILEG